MEAGTTRLNEADGVLVRPMRLGEEGLLEEFLYQAIHVPPGVESPARDVIGLPELRRYIEGFGRAGDACAVAETGVPGAPVVVGAAWARVLEPAGNGATDGAAVPDGMPELAISVLPGHRGRGIGGALLDALLDRLRSDGHAAVCLSVQRTNEVARRLYERRDFSVAEDHGDELIMVRRL